MSNQTDNNTLDHEIRVSTEQLVEGINQAVAQFEKLGEAAQRQSESMDASMSKIGKMAAAYFSFDALRDFAQSIVKVRGEIESLEISFETLLGSKDKADELFGAIKTYAATTPMTMDTLAKGAQTLLGFGIEAEKVMPIMQQIGDISMGDAQKFESLSLAFAQASSAGKLSGQDFLQMVNAGFNPLNEMAKTTGKSISQLKKEMEEGRIKTADLEAAFAAATAEGGMFHGMLEKQSHGIQGALSNLQGAWDDMLNSIGEKQQSVFVDGVNLLTGMVQHYEVFMNALLSVAAAYGTYKAVLMGWLVVQKAVAFAENIQLIMMFRKELGLLTAAQQAFNITAWANPYVLLAAAIVGVITGLVLYANSASEACDAQSALNSERDEFNKSLDEERKQIEDCINIVKSKTATDYQQAKAYETLKKICPEITDAYTREALAASDLADTTKILEERQDKLTYDHAVSELQKWEKAMKAVQDADGNWGKLNEEDKAVVKTVHSWGLLNNAIPKIQEMVDKYRGEVEEMDEIRAKAAEAALPLEQRIELKTQVVSDAQAAFDQARQELDAAEKAFANDPSIWNMWAKIRCKVSFEMTKTDLDNANADLGTVQAEVPKTYKEALKDATTALNNAKKELAKAKQSGTEKEYNDAKEKYDEAKKTYEGLGGTVKSDSSIASEAKQRAKKIKDLNAELKKLRIDGALEIESLVLKTMEDGMKVRLKQIDLNQRKEIAAVENEQKQLAAKLAEVGMKIPADVAAQFAKRIQAIKDASAVETRKVEEENAKYIAGIYRELGDVFNTEEQRKIAGIKQRYAEQRKQFDKDLAGGTITETDYNKMNAQNQKAEAHELEQYWLDTYGDYYQKRQTLQETWENNLKGVPAKYAAQAREQMMQELSAMDVEQFKKNFNWDLMFGDLGNQSVESLQFTLERVRAQFEKMKTSMDVTEIAKWQDAMKNLEDEITNRNPFVAFHASIIDISKAKQDLVSALQEMGAASRELTAAQTDYDAALLYEQQLRDLVDKGLIAADDERIATATTRLTDARTRLNKATERNGRAEQGVVKAQNNATKSYKTFGKAMQNVGGIVTDLGGKTSKLARVFSANVADGIDKAMTCIDDLMTAVPDTMSAIEGVSKWVSKSIEGTADAAGQAMQGTAAAAATSISTMEKASIILTVISAALQIATAIASLFNNDDSKQKEIDKLQDRINQLQWELDNADAIRLQNKTGDALERLKQLTGEATAEITAMHYGINAMNDGYSQWMATAFHENEVMQRSVEKIADMWGSVEYSADKALGAEKYDNSRKQLENLAEQQLLVKQQMDEEMSKKETDDAAVQGYKNKIAELAEDMATLINEMLEDIIGSTAEDLATTLGDAFFDAVAAGEDAMEAWRKKTNEIVADILKRMMITKYLEPEIGKVFDKYKAQWFGKDGSFKGIDAVTASADAFAGDINAVGESFKAIWDGLSSSFGSYFDGDSSREGSQKGIATASQESVDENNARLTTIQGHTYSLVQGMNDLNATANAMLERLSGIEDNTGKTADSVAETRDMVRAVRNTLDDITTRGLKLK